MKNSVLNPSRTLYICPQDNNCIQDQLIQANKSKVSNMKSKFILFISLMGAGHALALPASEAVIPTNSETSFLSYTHNNLHVIASITAKPSLNITELRSTSSPAPTPTSTRVPCEFLKIFCECGDHHMHWSEEEKRCQCPVCEPVVSLRCENLKIYCNDGDHLMHWDPTSKECKCPPPMITDYTPEPLPTM